MVMIGPLVVLATLSVIGGFPGVPPENGWFHHFLHSVAGAAGEEHATAPALMLGLMGTATVIALLGWGLAHYFYSGPSSAADALAARMPGVYTTLLNKYFVDELYDRLFVEPTKQIGRLCDWFDRTIIDGLVRSIDRGQTPVRRPSPGPKNMWSMPA